MDSVAIVAVRHGEQVREGSDGPLTPRGHQQAALAAQAVAITPDDLLISSSLLRARETARAFGREPMAVDGLDEFRFGRDWTWDQAEEREDLVLWRPDDRAGGESLAEFQARVEAALDRLIALRPKGRLILCVHSGVIDAIVRWGFGLSPHTEWTAEADAPHASITELHHWPTGRHVRGAPRFTILTRIGDAHHLPAELINDW